jgi:hypothetical protein
MSREAGGVREFSEFLERTAAGLRSGSWPFIWGVLAALVCAGMGRLEPALGEEGLIVHGAQRMLHGERLYADMISFTGPFPFSALVLLFRVFGEEILVARIAIAVGHGIATALVFKLARHAQAGGLAHAAAALWTVAPALLFPLPSNYYYSTISVQLSVFAAYAALGAHASLARAALTGALIACVALSKQSIGPLLGLGLFVALVLNGPVGRRWRAPLAVGYSAVACLLLTAGYYAWLGDFDALVRSTVLVPLGFGTGYVQPYMNLWPPGVLEPEIRGLATYYLPTSWVMLVGRFQEGVGFGVALATQILYALPLLAVLATVVRRYGGPLGLPLAAHTAFLVAQIGHLVPRSDWGHLVFVLPAAAVQLLLLAPQATGRRAPSLQRVRRLGGAAAAALGALGVVTGVALADMSVRAHMGPHIKERPVSQGRNGSREKNLRRLVRYIREHTQPGDPIFVARAEPLIYFATQTRNPTPYPGVVQAIREEQQDTILAALESTRLVVMSEIDQPVFTYYRDELPRVQAYLERHYHIPQVFIDAGNNWILVLERGADRGPSLYDFYENDARGVRFVYDAQGRRQPAQRPDLRLQNKYNRRPLAVPLGPLGGGVEFSVEIPEDARLQIGVGRRPTQTLLGYLPPPLGARARISIGRGQSFALLAESEVRSDRNQGLEWIEHEVDLARFAGQQVTLRFEFRAERPLARARYAWFGSPRLAGPPPAVHGFSAQSTTPP